MSQTTLVTGATGYLGRRLIERLQQKKQGTIRALVRPTSNVQGLRESGVELIEGDMTDAASLKRAVQGVDRVFHVAAYVTRWTKNPEMFDKINIHGTQALLEAAREAGVQDFVYTSSFIALGPSGEEPGDESLAHAGGFRNDYERTKKLALDIAQSYADQGIGLKIVFPGVIYGPGTLTEGNLVAGIIQDYLKRSFTYLGKGDLKWCYSYVDDVVEGHILASEKGKEGESYILGGENLTMKELVHYLWRFTGVPQLPFSMPFPLGKLAGWLNEKAAPLGVPVKITRGEVEIFRHSWAYSSQKAVEELGYPITPADEAMKTTIDWVQHEVSGKKSPHAA